MYRFYGYAIEDTSHIENNYERAVKFCNANGLDVKLIKQLFYFDGASSKEVVAVEEPNPYKNADEGLYGPEYEGQQAPKPEST